MNRNRLKFSGRKKAQFGTAEAAILAAAGINAATQMVAAGINSSATKQAARDQAAAINQQAQRQAQAIKDQTAKSREYQQESQEFIKEQNAENRALQRDIQMQLQLLTGQQNTNDRLEASKIQVRNGGNMRHRLATGGNSTFPLQGSYNLPFIVTDGGGVVNLGQTPEGYDLYELYGNDHEHYHKAKNGKSKSGVGIKFADGVEIEGEGNQNGSKGEKMLVTPNNAYFISRHTLRGFNPANAVDAGMNPIDAYVLQEEIKAENGISDDGKNNSPVKKMMGGNFVYDLYNANGPQLDTDTIGDTTVGIVYDTQNQKRLLRCGGRLKAKRGTRVYKNTANIKLNTIPLSGISVGGIPNVSFSGSVNPNINIESLSRDAYRDYLTGHMENVENIKGINTGGRGWNNAELWGAGIGALGNLGGAFITADANKRAADILAGAYNNSSQLLADAYRQMRTIDMSSIKRDDYSAAHAMASLQAPVSFAQNKIAEVNRQLQRRLENAGRYSASGASALDRMAKAETDAQDMRNKIYSADAEQMQTIRQANAERDTAVSIQNAKLDVEANKYYTNAYLNMLQYNNDIENQRLLGSAGALAEGGVNAAGALANAQTSNAQAWSGALTGSTQGFTNALTTIANRRSDILSALLGSNSDTAASYYARMAPRGEAMRVYNSLVNQYNNTTDLDNKKRLARQINNIAAHRGLRYV